MISSIFLFIGLTPVFAIAANDWTVPCFQGVCSYDIKQDNNTMPATMIITGSRYSISDITGAAGWEIIECDVSATTQDIRLVCTGEDDQSTGCDHLYERGAPGTIVRLPESCGKGPFARVARAWTPEDQSVPDPVVARLRRRDGTIPTVRALSLDTQFNRTSDFHGEVSMLIYASNNQNQTEANLTPRSLNRRTLGNAFKQLANDSPSLSFNESIIEPLPPIEFTGDFPIFNATIDCSQDFSASLAVNITSNSTAQVNLGIIAAGKLVPFEIEQFAVVADLSADLNASLKVDASVQGSLDSGKILLFEQGIPGFSIPGVITVGPSFKLNAQAIATLDINLGLTADLAYKVDNTRLFFPPQNGLESKGNAKARDTPVQLSISSNVTSEGSLEAHLIPTIDIGLEALTFVTSVVFIELDSAAILNLNLSSGSSKEDDSGFNGCVELLGAIQANAGAEASFFDLFEANTEVTIFETEFELFKRCFGNGDVSDSDEVDTPEAVTSPPAMKEPTWYTPYRRAENDLLCPPPDVQGPITLIQNLIGSDK